MQRKTVLGHFARHEEDGVPEVAGGAGASSRSAENRMLLECAALCLNQFRLCVCRAFRV